MNADDDDLSNQERFDLHISDQTVKDIMGPTPIPSLMIEIDEIQDQFQKMMAQEIQCVVCKEFPHKPLECSSCHKMICEYC